MKASGFGQRARQFAEIAGWAWDHSIGWLLAMVLITGIRGYQILLSPLLPPSCRFYPCCSAYALGAVRAHGPLKGFILACWRLVRCNPWNGGGFDPVPAPHRWRSDILSGGSPGGLQSTAQTTSTSARNPTGALGAARTSRKGAHVHP